MQKSIKFENVEEDSISSVNSLVTSLMDSEDRLRMVEETLETKEHQKRKIATDGVKRFQTTFRKDSSGLRMKRGHTFIA